MMVYIEYMNQIQKDYNPDKEVIVMDPLSVPLSDPFGEYTSFEPKYNDEGKLMTAKK